MKVNFWGIFFMIFLVSCGKKNKVEQVERAFYYWQSNSEFSDETVKNLNQNKITKIYYKLFEVDYSDAQGNFPFEKNSPSNYTFKDLKDTEVVPTVFIKNDIFQYNNNASLDKLADNMVFLIDKYHAEQYDNYNRNQQLSTYFEYNEIQIDCDWTKTTKDKYFYLLEKIKQKSKKQISCTLRLYPYKFPEIMGVPPVDKVMLMCYNLIKPLTEKNKNSILDLNEFKKYTDKVKKYPIHLDVALPLFYWSQHYQNNQFSSLLKLNSKEIEPFTKKIKPFWYEVTKDTTLEYNEYLRKGDQLKCEEVKLEDLNKIIQILKTNVLFDSKATISIFNLDEKTFKNYTNEEISSIYGSFTK